MIKILFLFIFIGLPVTIVIGVAIYLLLRMYGDWRIKHYSDEQWREIFNDIQIGDIFVKKSDWSQYQYLLKRLNEFPSIQNPWDPESAIDEYANRISEKKDGWVKIYNNYTRASHMISIKDLIMDYKKSYL